MKNYRFYAILILVLTVCFTASGPVLLYAQDAAPDSGTEETLEENPSSDRQKTLQIRASFEGWENNKSIEIASLTSEEMERWCLYEQDYTFYDPESGVFVDHVLGVSLFDLVDWLSIDAGEIREFRFICQQDSETLVKEIPAEEILGAGRYFYGDLPGYGDLSSAADEENASAMKQEVETLLALQDHWMTEEEYLDPETDVEAMTDEYAFRLIPGQRTITDCTMDLAVSGIKGMELLLENTPSIQVTPAEINENAGISVPVGLSIDTCGYPFLEDLEIFWRSEDESAVTVDSSGMVSIRSRKPASITVTAAGMVTWIPVNQTLSAEEENTPMTGKENNDAVQSSREENRETDMHGSEEQESDFSSELGNPAETAEELRAENGEFLYQDSGSADPPSESQTETKWIKKEIVPGEPSAPGSMLPSDSLPVRLKDSRSEIDRSIPGNPPRSENAAEGTGMEMNSITDAPESGDGAPDTAVELLPGKDSVYEIRIDPPVSSLKEALPPSASAGQMDPSGMLPERKNTRRVIIAAIFVFLLGIVCPPAARKLIDDRKDRRKRCTVPVSGDLL